MQHLGETGGYKGNEQRVSQRDTQARYFDEMVDLFDQPQPPYVEENLRRIAESARVQHEDTVLDVGAGTGVLIPFIQAFRPTKILACDISQKMLSRLIEKNPEVETHLQDITELSLQDESINVIFMNAVFPNIIEKKKALRNCSRMLKKGGRIIISHPEGRSFVERLTALLPFHIDPMPLFPELRRLLDELPLVITYYLDTASLYLAVIEKF